MRLIAKNGRILDRDINVILSVLEVADDPRIQEKELKDLVGLELNNLATPAYSYALLFVKGKIRREVLVRGLDRTLKNEVLKKAA